METTFTSMGTDIIQYDINRVIYLTMRVNEIEEEIDEIHERLYQGFMTRKQFTDLVSRRSALFIEKENKENELQERYHVIDEAESLF